VGPRNPLGIPRFRAMWSATVFSATGTFIQTVAGSWLMLELTGSNTWVGLMVASAMLPLLFFSLTAGALADIFDRAKIMVIAQAIMGISALAMAMLTQFGRITPGLLLLLGLLLGTGGALNLPASQALLPELVPRGMIASAVALQSAAFNAARAVGPALGGALVAAYGAAIGFGINSITYLAMIAVILFVAPTLAARERESASVFNATTTGLRYARYTPRFRNLLGLAALFAVTSAVVQAALPGHTEYLGGSASMYGVLLGAMGLGALVGLGLRSRIVAMTTRHIVPVGIVLFGFAGIGLGMAPNLWLAGLAMVAAGAFWLLTLATLNTTAQLLVPDWIKGRAMSLYNLAFAGILPLGAILAGVVADQVGTPATIVGFSIGSVVLGLVAPRFGVPRVEEIEDIEFSAFDSSPHSDSLVDESGPVIVLNTWVIEEDEYPAFLKVMQQLRMVRLSTGAYRWRLLRNVSDPTRVTELFVNHSWEEHLAQHRRIDDGSARIIARARDFDRAEGPITRHLIAVDVTEALDRLEFEAMVASHEEMHRTDGSIPLPVGEDA
jgi:MFS family permease